MSKKTIIVFIRVGIFPVSNYDSGLLSVQNFYVGFCRVRFCHRTTVLIYHHHKLLDLILLSKLTTVSFTSQDTTPQT
jgi:hypothetical protein